MILEMDGFRSEMMCIAMLLSVQDDLDGLLEIIRVTSAVEWGIKYCFTQRRAVNTRIRSRT